MKSKILLAVLAFALIVGCGASTGIEGRAEKWTGNFMPWTPTGTVQALSVPIYVFSGRIMPFDVPDPHHPALVTIGHSDAHGMFRIELPPGEYTVVAEIEGRLYLNDFESDGFWSHVDVSRGHWVSTRITDTRDAFF